MRLRLVFQLSLLLLAAVLLAVTAMGGVVAWNLRTGFVDYLHAREAERFDRFAMLVAEVIEQRGVEVLRQPQAGRWLFDEFAQREGIPENERPGRPPPPPPFDENDSDRLPPQPPDPPPRPRNPAAFDQRVALFDLQGARLAGPPQPQPAGLPEPRIQSEQPILAHGRPVASLRIYALDEAPRGVDARFLTRQYSGIVVVAALLVLLALLAASIVARRWAQPLRHARDATRRIAEGEFGVRLHEAGPLELAGLARSVNTMAVALARLDGTRKRWIAEISHELRTPLAVLRGELEALQDGVRPFDARALTSLHDEVLQLGRLVDDLHELATSYLRTLPCNFSDWDGRDALRVVQERYRVAAGAKGLEMTVALPDAPVPVRWDAGRINQLLANVVSNSVSYTDAPGRIEISLTHTENKVLIEIQDTAPGITAEDALQLFEPLYRAEAARSRRTGGSGLGLAICEAIVRAHGGTITAAASPLGGVRISAELPKQAEAA